MLTYIAVIALVLAIIWVLSMALVWTRGGLGKGRRFGNKIAKHLGLSNNFFHSVLELGVSGPSLLFLAMLEDSGCTLERASFEVAPSLARGLIALEKKFGHQEMIENAKPIVVQLLKGWEELPDQREQ